MLSVSSAEKRNGTGNSQMHMQNNKETTVKFIIVGCGRIAERHAEHIAKLGHLVAVCDVKPERVRLFTQKYGAQGFIDIDALLLAHLDADVVSVCTPNGLHAEHSIKALRAGYHVICEKPMALSVSDCERMIMEAEKSGKKLFIVKQNRFNPPVVETKRLIDEGKLGEILSVQLNCFWNRNEGYYKTSDWKGTRALDGGVLYTQFSHFIDLLYWMFGEVEEVTAHVGNSNHPYTEIDDHGVAVVKFANGVIGTIHFSTNAHKKNLEGSITIFGEKGTVKVGGEYLNVLEHASVEGYTPPELPAGVANDYGTYKGSMSNHDKVYQNVLAVLKENAPISTSGMEGLKTVAIIRKIYDSSGF